MEWLVIKKKVDGIFKKLTEFKKEGICKGNKKIATPIGATII